MSQAVEPLPYKSKALSSNYSSSASLPLSLSLPLRLSLYMHMNFRKLKQLTQNTGTWIELGEELQPLGQAAS
jgi:hypothetical protein